MRSHAGKVNVAVVQYVLSANCGKTIDLRYTTAEARRTRGASRNSRRSAVGQREGARFDGACSKLGYVVEFRSRKLQAECEHARRAECRFVTHGSRVRRLRWRSARSRQNCGTRSFAKRWLGSRRAATVLRSASEQRCSGYSVLRRELVQQVEGGAAKAWVQPRSATAPIAASIPCHSDIPQVRGRIFFVSDVS